MKREITREDILPMAEYEAMRKEHRRDLVEKKNRRLDVGPVCTFYFESFATMWAQVHAMLFIEKGGEAQISDELSAYNPLIPKGDELVATVMFEIDDPARRVARQAGRGRGDRFPARCRRGGRGLARGGRRPHQRRGQGILRAVFHFKLTPGQIAKFRAPGAEVVVGFTHPEYGHMVVLPEAVRQALSQDFE